MIHILKFNEANGAYAGEWPLNKQQIGLDAGDVSSNPDFARSENKFQEVQEYMKLLLKPILLKKNPNCDDTDIEKVSDSFFRLGNNKAQEIKKLVDGCKDTKQCARQIIDTYLKYVKINFNTKDDINNVEQDSVMASEKASFNEVCPECDGKGYTEKGKCKQCKGTGLLPQNKRIIKKIDEYLDLNEGKASNVIVFPTFIRYNGEDFPGINIPKKYIGKGKFRFRVLAREGDKVKPINFGDRTTKIKPMNKLSKKYWDSLPNYK
jgi:hypothetical protein